MSNKYIYAIGRRKRATASIKMTPGTGKIMVNAKPVEGEMVFSIPFEMVGQESKFDVDAKVSGGGISSQKESIRLAISRALVDFSKDFKKTLKKAGFLTRDPREKERKKPGLKRARRAPQWSKR